MTALRKFHLFNCDRVYKLDSIEDLLMVTKAKLGVEFSVEKHYFPLSGIPELSRRTIPELQIDYAILAVHANESCLSINNGGGYTEVYRALMQATGDNVIVVIGGDDNYKNETEEEQSVISRWALKKIARSQLSQEVIDGRKSFVFSWNKKHRAIHEEALLHYFDPSKKGQKFEFQPRKMHLQPDPVSSRAVVNDERTSWENKEEHPLSQVGVAQEEKLKGLSLEGLSSNVTKEKAITHHNAEGVQAKTSVPLVIKEEHEPEALAVLGCNVSAESMEVVKKVIDDIRPRLNLSRNLPIENLSPFDTRSYLRRNPVRFCVLVVDAVTLRNAQESSPERKRDLEDLIRTAADNVVDKVILTICGPCHLPSREEEIFAHSFEGILKEKGKGLTVWLEDGKLNVEPDILMQLMLQTSTMDETKRREGYQGELPAPADVAPEFSQSKPREHLAGPPQKELYYETYPGGLPEEQLVKPPQVQLPAAPNCEGLQLDVNESLMLKTRIRDGKVSFEPQDVEFTYPDWIIPQHLVEIVERKQFPTHDGELFVISDEKGNLKFTVRSYRTPLIGRYSCSLV